MICPKCKVAGIKNCANGKDFYYCRTCKEEIFEKNDSMPDHSYSEWDQEYLDGLLQGADRSGQFLDGTDKDYLDEEDLMYNDFSDKWGGVWGD